MDESPPLETQEKEVPRWVQVPSGVAIGLFTLLCGYASLSLLLAPPKQNPALGYAFGLLLLFGCFWVFEKCLRLLTGRKNQGGLMAPKTLRRLSWWFLILPVAGLFTGYYRRMGVLAIIQAMIYPLTFLGLRALARNRQAKDAGSGNTVSTSPDRLS